MPLRFETGGSDSHQTFDAIVRGRGYTVVLNDGSATLTLPSHGNQRNAIRMTLDGGNPDPVAAPLEQQAGVTNYLLGADPSKWRTGVPGYGKVKYTDVYPGIDLIFYGNAGRDLEYDFVVAPGADPSVIALRFDGADEMRIDAAGELVLAVGTGEVRQKAPHIYQRRQDGRTDIIRGRHIEQNGAIRFELDSYDRTVPLVIDPVVVFATYLGSSDEEANPSIASDAAGNVYLLGHTWGADYPTDNGIQPSKTPGGVSTEVVLTKVSPEGTLVYSTYLGGSGNDEVRDIAVSPAGEPYLLVICGPGFPVAPGYRFERPGSTSFACIVRLNASGTALVYEARISASLEDIALDANGNVALAGQASVTETPPLVNPAQGSPGGQNDAFILKLNADGTDVVFSTRLGGSGGEFSRGVAFDASGFVYVAGRLDQSTGTDFPVQGAPVHGPGGNVDTFLASYSPTGIKQFSTYFGGSSSDFVDALDVDADGFIYLGGSTTSTDFPTANAIKPMRTYTDEAFACRFAPGAESFVYSTHLGEGRATDIAAGPAGEAYFVGDTGATDLSLRLPFDRTLGGAQDAFVFKLAPDGALMHSSYFGGSSLESGVSGASVVALGPRGSIYIAGTTNSSDVELLNPIQTATPPFHLTNFFLARLSTVAEITGISPRAVRPGIGGPITVSGRNFFGNTRVFVGGQWATNVSVQSLVSLTATMPALPAGTYDVVVINPDGEVATLPDALVYDDCTITVGSPGELLFEGTGGMRAIDVSVSSTACEWPASSNVPWITASRAPGSGSATIINVASNLTGALRSGTVTIAGRDFTVVQMALSVMDLNGDARTDVLWWNDQDGSLGVWLVDGRTFLGAVSLTPGRVPDVDWRVVAAGDVDGDGDADIVWRNQSTGVLVGWLMNGATKTGDGVIGRVDDPAWKVRASGDFDRDGRADLVWQHEGDGRIALWIMNGLQNAGAELLPYAVPDTDWHIVGTGDFDRDGRRDLLWRHQTSGQIAVWLMDGRRLIDGRLLPFVVDPAWQLRAVADVDGNGSSDWLWQLLGDGRPVVWLMNGLTRLSGGPLGPFDSVDNAWHIVGPK